MISRKFGTVFSSAIPNETGVCLGMLAARSQRLAAVSSGMSAVIGAATRMVHQPIVIKGLAIVFILQSLTLATGSRWLTRKSSCCRRRGRAVRIGRPSNV